MSIYEFKNRLNLIMNFTIKMDKESVPANIQRIFVKTYAATLKINLTDKMISDII